MTQSDSEDRGSMPGRRQRIAKLMARAGLCSRRDAEAWILAGRVSVNGTVLSSPAVDVAPDDAILIDGARLPAIEKTRLFLFHKPRGLVTSDHDPEGRPTVAGFLHANWPDGPRVVTVGRLDINTEGLLLLTNDGGLARVLELPQTGWLRRYRVRAKGTANPAALDALAEGVTLDGITYAGIEAKLDRTQGANVWLTMGLREGKNREVKRVLEHLGLEVNRLIRISFGPFQLADLPEGGVEEVRTRVLRDQLGAKLAAQAGVDFDEPHTDTPRSEGRPEAATRAKPSQDDARPRPQTIERRDRARPSRHGQGAPESRSKTPRPGNHRDHRRSPSEDVQPQKRERPSGGPRKHVTALRKHAASASEGPRTRIERSDTRDRRDRTVLVERRISLRKSEADTDATRQRSNRRGSSTSDRPDRGRHRPMPEDRERTGSHKTPSSGARQRDDRKARPTDQRRRESPAAAGKRERIARSGPRNEGRRDAPERPASASRPRSPRPPQRTEPQRPGRDRRADGGKPTSHPRKAGETSRRPPAKRPAKRPGARPRSPSKPKR